MNDPQVPLTGDAECHYLPLFRSARTMKRDMDLIRALRDGHWSGT